MAVNKLGYTQSRKSASCSGQYSLQAVTLGAALVALLEDSLALSSVCIRYQRLEEASASLRERIRHLDDMVHCQQKKVKQMVEEVSPCERAWARDCFLWWEHFSPRARYDSQLHLLWLTVN